MSTRAVYACEPTKVQVAMLVARVGVDRMKIIVLLRVKVNLHQHSERLIQGVMLS